jgi:ribosome maturation factor RimP
LRDARDYERFTGRAAKVVVDDPVDGQTAFAGRIRGLEDGSVVFEAQGQKWHRIALDNIKRARLDVEF